MRGMCNCCQRHGIVGVYSSGYGAISFGWCIQCLRMHVEPEFMLAFLYYDVGYYGKGLRPDEELPGTFRDGRYWTWREWADRFAKEFEPPPTYYSEAWTGRDPWGFEPLTPIDMVRDWAGAIRHWWGVKTGRIDPDEDPFA